MDSALDLHITAHFNAKAKTYKILCGLDNQDLVY